MRKFCFSTLVAISIILLAVSLSLGQTPRQPTSSEGKTSFTNIAVGGLNQDGVPGYIEMVSSDGELYYLYIDDYGYLRIASGMVVGSTTSPQTTDWSNAGVPVGLQSYLFGATGESE